MRAVDIIDKKKNSVNLTQAEISFMVNGFMSGQVADYQMSAFLMAVCTCGMSKDETIMLTDSMLKSGQIIPAAGDKKLTVDKHSTGGVGDKTTLVVGPICAALGLHMSKMSGRALGFTGGTIDKLESISGFKSDISRDDFEKLVLQNGFSVISQSGNIAPADKKIYALRDVTATVDSIPLIASSIMSKKLACPAGALLLDVKVGTGAFMTELSAARQLAKLMVEIGLSNFKNTKAIITDMNQPLGKAVGNSLEVLEAVEALKGKSDDDFLKLCIEISALLAHMAGKFDDIEAARCAALDTIRSGGALKRLEACIYGQGACTGALDRLEPAKFSFEYKSKLNGYVDFISCKQVGIASMLLGAGRARKDDNIDYGAGIYFHKKQGGYVKSGEVIATLYSSDKSLFENAAHELDNALVITEKKPAVRPLIYEII